MARVASRAPFVGWVASVVAVWAACTYDFDEPFSQLDAGTGGSGNGGSAGACAAVDASCSDSGCSSCDDCWPCATKTGCSSYRAECGNTPECQAIATCTDPCEGLDASAGKACISTCEQLHPSAVSMFEQVITCLCAACPSCANKVYCQ